MPEGILSFLAEVSRFGLLVALGVGVIVAVWVESR